MTASPHIVRGADAPMLHRGASVGERMTQAAHRFGDVLQSFWSDGEVTAIALRELDRRAHDLAWRLMARGIARGDRVAIQMPNRIETLIVYRACLLIGAVLVPVVPIFGAAELTHILQDSRARLLVVPDQWRNMDFHERIGQLGHCPALADILFVGQAGLAGSTSWADLLSRAVDPRELPALAETDPALLLFTSGTTLRPKGVIHTHRSLLGELDQRLAGGERARSTTFSPWPSGHIAGFNALTNPLVTGSASILMDRWSAAEGARLISAFGADWTAGVPVMLNELLDAAQAQSIDLGCVRSYMVGAANVPPSLVQRAQALGIAVFRCYGSSEHPTVSSGSADDPLHIRAETDGPVLPGTEVRLLDEHDRDVAGIGEGEIVTRGLELFAGYTDAAANAEAFLPGGWFRTGDIGRFEDGCLIITDRKKDIIIRGGENISSKEIEDTAARHSAVHEAAAFAFQHERLGEGIAVAVVLQPGRTMSLDDLKDHFAQSGLASAKTPERIIVLDEFPRTPSGKVRKVELRAHFGQRS